MTKNEFHQFVDFVINTGLKPPEVLFCQGVEDWYTRASLAKFLCHPAYHRIDTAIHLFETVVDVPVSSPADIEHKAWSLRKLSWLLRKHNHQYSRALPHINESIRLAESIDCPYHVIVRGELWAQRWIILSSLQQPGTALLEADQKIHEFTSCFAKNNSYLYNAYRFKAQVAGSQGKVSEALLLMKKGLSYIRLNEEDKKNLAISFSAKHKNIALLFQSIDLATPKEIAWII